MLEQQQTQLVNGIQELYDRCLNSQGWKGAPLKDCTNGHPLIHDILERLGALKIDNHHDYETFEEDFEAMQEKLVAEGRPSSHRQGSTSSSWDDVPYQKMKQEPTSPKLFSDDTFPAPHAPCCPPSPSSPASYLQTPIDSPFPPSSLTEFSQMNPSILHTEQPLWPQPTICYDEEMAFSPFENTSFDSMRMMQQKANLCLPTTPWVEDDLGGFNMKSSLAQASH